MGFLLPPSALWDVPTKEKTGKGSAGTRQTTPSSKGTDRRGSLMGGGTNEGNLGRKTLLGG